jgi:hypothetical protein
MGSKQWKSHNKTPIIRPSHNGKRNTNGTTHKTKNNYKNGNLRDCRKSCHCLHENHGWNNCLVTCNPVGGNEQCGGRGNLRADDCVSGGVSEIYCDIVVDYELDDWEGLKNEFTAYMKKRYPKQEIDLTVETEYV